MPILTWNDNLSVGIFEMDTQHKRLVGMLNDLADAMSKGQSAEVMGPILNNLISYTVTHFAAEERLMKQHNYPGYAKQKEEHEALTWKVKDLNERYIKGQIMLSVETLTFLKTWLTDHIQGTDKQYSAFFKEHGVR